MKNKIEYKKTTEESYDSHEPPRWFNNEDEYIPHITKEMWGSVKPTMRLNGKPIKEIIIKSCPTGMQDMTDFIEIWNNIKT